MAEEHKKEGYKIICPLCKEEIKPMSDFINQFKPKKALKEYERLKDTIIHVRCELARIEKRPKPKPKKEPQKSITSFF